MADETGPRGLAALLALWRDAARQRKLASLAIALLLEGLIALLLLTLGASIVGKEDGKEDVTTFKAVEFAAPPQPEQPPPPETSEAQTAEDAVPVTPQPQPMRPSPLALNPQPAPEPPPPAPTPPQPEPTPQPQTPAKSKIGARIRPNQSYGPVDSGNPRMVGDSEQVGTMANGEPLYAARWYREPTDQELAGYLSTANGPGVALIACRTVAGYYVEDCQLLGESPQGSQIGRAVMAAAWQFRVRPARIGGREQFGSWVRIRITYSVSQKPR
jgi:protein TonB